VILASEMEKARASTTRNFWVEDSRFWVRRKTKNNIQCNKLEVSGGSEDNRKHRNRLDVSETKCQRT
jgi:hypothetical protein